MSNLRLITGLVATSVAILIAACAVPPTPDPPAAAPTVTLRPIVKPTVTPLASPTPAASATPTPDSRIMTAFAAEVNPLTGEKVADPTVLNRRPLAIKIENGWEAGVRPQAGASFADWVIEHESEGGIPRWTAIFYGETPARVGGTRSCRIIDTEIPAIFKSLLACSGMSGGTREYYIKPSDFNQEGRMFTPDFGDGAPMFYRTDNRAIPHNLYVNAAAIWQKAVERNVNARPDLTGLAFSTQPLLPAQSVSEVTLKYGSETEVWKFDSQAAACGSLTGCWLRWSGGVPHTDALNGQQLSVANVIVIYANHVEDGRFLEEDYPQYGVKAFGIQIQLWNSGPVKIFRDGQVFEGTWSRPERHQMLKFTNAAGDLIPLKPGKSWIELQRLDASITVAP
jgi:hypothetical protein